MEEVNSINTLLFIQDMYQADILRKTNVILIPGIDTTYVLS